MTNPIFNAVTQVVNMIVGLVPGFCPQPQNDVPMMDLDSMMYDMGMDDDTRRFELETLPASADFAVDVMRRRECLNSRQKRNMQVTMAISSLAQTRCFVVNTLLLLTTIAMVEP